MLSLIAWLLSWIVPSGLERTAPSYLTESTGREHLASAVVASFFTSVPAPVLLSIAHHESRYSWTEETPLGDGTTRVSCGVMTPEPVASCQHTNLTDSYLSGARHLRVWLDATRTPREAFLGYAGGYRLIRACRESDAPRQCEVADDFASRAELIARVLRAR